jgi:sugar lactone lactonase YvrE
VKKRAPLFAFSLIAAGIFGCSSAPSGDVSSSNAIDPGSDEPVNVIRSVAGITLGEPLAVAIDFNGNLLIADGVPGRLVRIDASLGDALEFDRPAQNPGFYPTALNLSGFYIYALDAVGRKLLRFDNTGFYRDILINFDEVVRDARTSPVGMDVDGTGKIAISDVSNHQIIVFDTYLQVELAFGNYGSSPGQFDSPEGVSFTRKGGLLVADTGNRRIQLLDAGGAFVRALPLGNAENPLVRPRRAVMDQNGQVFVADPQAGRVFVFGEDGSLLRSIAPLGAKRFQPSAVSVASSGLIYVTDTASSSLYVFR